MRRDRRLTGDALDRFRARIPVKHALCGEVDGRATCIVGAQAVAGAEQLAEALRSVQPADATAHVGEGHAVGELAAATGSYRRALAALRAAAERGQPVARWDDLRAHRLLTALPPSALDDMPPGLRRLLDGSHEQLVLTLETYLDHAGDVKSTAAELWLHRTSLYYRLRRVEEVAGVDLNRGEDRLLCHVALRLARLAQRAGGDVDHFARAYELHARAALRRAQAALVLVDRAPALPGDESRAALGEPTLVGHLGRRVQLARVAVLDHLGHGVGGVLLVGADDARTGRV